MNDQTEVTFLVSAIILFLVSIIDMLWPGLALRYSISRIRSMWISSGRLEDLRSTAANFMTHTESVTIGYFFSNCLDHECHDSLGSSGVGPAPLDVNLLYQAENPIDGYGGLYRSSRRSCSYQL